MCQYQLNIGHDGWQMKCSPAAVGLVPKVRGLGLTDKAEGQAETPECTAGNMLHMMLPVNSPKDVVGGYDFHFTNEKTAC